MSPDPLQPFLSQAGWVRELALRLVGDPHQADDLVQEAWIAALASRDPVHSTRAWLGSVVRRLAWQKLRSEGRRSQREEWAAQDEALDSAASVVERMSTHQVVVERVLSLPEAYRDVILWRYFDGDTPTEIAAREGIPVSTVKTRLQRALARLREELDEEYGGDGRGWMLALVPLASKAQQSAVSLLSFGAAMVMAALLLLGSWAALRARAPREEAAPLASLDPGLAADEVPGPDFGAEEKATRGSSRSRALPTAPTVDLDRELVRRQRRVAGRVLDAEGRSVAGAVLRFAPTSTGGRDTGGDAIALSSPTGEFELRSIRGAGQLLVEDPRRTVLFPVHVASSAAPDDLTVVVVERHGVRGRVVDSSGRGLHQVRIELRVPTELRSAFPGGLTHAGPAGRVTESGPAGTFELVDAPSVPAAELSVRHEGYRPRRLVLPLQEEVILLERTLATDGDWRGRVVDAEGRGVPDALVSAGPQATRSDASGSFHLEPVPNSPRIVAFHADFGLGFSTPPDLEASNRECLLRLHPPRELGGQVVDEQGQPRPGVRVWLDDASLLSLPDGDLRHQASQDLRFSLPPGDALSLRSLPVVAESLAAGRRNRPWTRVTTDEEGRFRLPGVGERAYRVALLDPSSLQVQRVAGCQPGDELRLTFPREGTTTIHLLVRDHQLRPLPGVKVALTGTSEQLRFGDTTILSRLVRLPLGRSDDQGRIAFQVTSGTGLRLEFEGAKVLDLQLDLPLSQATSLGRPWEVTLEPTATLRVVLGNPRKGTAFRLLHADGRPAVLERERGHEEVRCEWAELIAGRSELWRVSARAVEIELRGADGSLERRHVQLEASELTELTW